MEHGFIFRTPRRGGATKGAHVTFGGGWGEGKGIEGMLLWG